MPEENPQRMRVLYLLTQDLASPTGLGRFLPLATELSRKGHQVFVAALHPDFNVLEETLFELQGFQVHYVASSQVKKKGNIKSYYTFYQLIWVAMRGAWQLSRAALSTPVDIVHVGKPHPMNSLAGLLAKSLRGETLLLDCDDYEAGSITFAPGWQQKGVAWFEKWMPRRAQLVTTNTLFMQQKLMEWGIPADKIVYVPNGVDLARFQPPPTSQVDALRTQLGLQGKRVVAYIGSLSLASHPVDLLLQAFQVVTQSLPDTNLILVGGGDAYDTLKAQAKSLGIDEKVCFCGRIPPEQVVTYYHLAHVSVDPVYDNDAARGRSPLKLFESWACSVPFVSADVGDRRQLLGSPPAGLLARSGDPASLAGCIIDILRNPQLAADLGQRGVERVQGYTWDRLAQAMETVYLKWLK
jgi:glycosyltransferase involved in cell wall biosynthesis